MTIYSANYGGYDDLPQSSDIVYYNDIPNIPTPFDSSPLLSAKWHKVINPDQHSLWVDSNIEILDREGLFERLTLEQTKMGPQGRRFPVFIRHPFHKTLEQEFAACRCIFKTQTEGIDRLIDLYEKVWPDWRSSPVYVGSVIFRPNYEHRGLISFQALWWEYITTYATRDQLSLPYIVKVCREQYGLETGLIEDINIYNNPFIKIHPHAN